MELLDIVRRLRMNRSIKAIKRESGNNSLGVQGVAGADVEPAYAEALAPVVAGGVAEEFVLEQRADALDAAGR